MQFLIFHLGADRYGLHTQRVVRVVPVVELKTIPHAPEYVAGLFNFHGTPVPVLDLSRLATGVASKAWFSTRIVLVDYAHAGEDNHLLGLMLERVSGIERIAPDELVAPGIDTPQASYLGKVSARNGGIVQLVEVDRLLNDEVRALLFQSNLHNGQAQ